MSHNVLNEPFSDAVVDPRGAGIASARRGDLKITLISLHGLIRAHDPELGRDADTGGQVKYVLELAKELAAHSRVKEVEVLTRQIIDPKVDDAYAQVEEPISENAKIVRIPFGPKRYLRKESLWPYLELFIDQTLQHFRRTGLPDIIHGHYADAGVAGAQLARLLHIPYVFTGHSLGRVKRQRLSLGKTDPESMDKLESRYKFTARIEAEELALETASMVVTSTNQEVQQQYELYDHYEPARMEVIPPGVDLSSFSPAKPDWKTPAFAEELKPFLREPDKPMILTMARPDERKNLEMLVKVYGESEQLQEKANLVMVMGTRDDLRDLPKSQRTIINRVLYLVDRYNLYGKVAYPKTHTPSDVPELYRLATSLKGVFINPALTEPFGLTLLEAGATGLPVVATNDGGPRDIIANCQNGLLVDPLDKEAIEHALLRVLTEPEQWSDWSTNGIAGTREHYSWNNHAQRYLRDLQDILEHSPAPVLADKSTSRRLPEFDRLIITDLDNTLTGDDEALQEFIELIRANDHIGFGIATGRRLDSAMELIQELGLPQPDLIDTDAGTQLHYGENLTPDLSWRKSIDYAWQPEKIREVLDSLPGFFPQIEEHQSEFKISYEIDTSLSPSLSEIKKILREAGLRAKVVMSLGMYLDVIPVRGGSDLSMRHVLWKWGFAPEHVLVSGDSGNDAGMLLGRTLGVVVGNHSEELERLRNRPRVYFAQATHAAGILEGIKYYNFLDKITIPNDRIE
ncbi:HAD-IIB family hydrolase [Gimesia chilikensis]|uniref:sucrose-phosphate synthase n=1 Tax=Gimesia chilikensis TaxID=2605989 RepID=A0A517PNA0_9PLAN|nr:HAD-IIB family hydrolase [Gimesia chilikensis]MBN72370.1 HAD family hydrolase [Gimesia sp.]QDT20854.1 Mannosylfructose-phosphate synthase [Gimesia chilikensis]QDT84751.1 Mannosylfructose-phosphate synthase [Gimesia chilikensis]